MSKYAIVDLEMCRVPKKTKGYTRSMEIIQIGAVLLDEELKVVDTFDTYVKPQFGYIDDFIIDLTGIRERDVNGASMIEEAMKSFISWLPEDAVCVSWSEADKHQIKKELKEKNIYIPRIDSVIENWVDCQKTFSGKMKEKKAYSLQEALYIADIEPEGQAHNGLIDAKNTATLFVKMENESDIIKNPIYQKLKSGEKEELTYSLGDLFSQIKLA